MTPDLLGLIGVALEPREALVLRALGEADPDALTLADIADCTRCHIAGFGTVAATLHARGFIAREPGRPGERVPLYRLLPRGATAYRQLEQLHVRRLQSRDLAAHLLITGHAA